VRASEKKWMRVKQYAYYYNNNIKCNVGSCSNNKNNQLKFITILNGKTNLFS